MFHAAIIRNGSEGITTYMEQIEDSHGDLIDLKFSCAACFENLHLYNEYSADWWPAFLWPDYDAHCHACGKLLNKGKEDEEIY